MFEIWEHNVPTVRELNAARKKQELDAGFATALVAHLKACAVALVKIGNGSADHNLNVGAVKAASATPQAERPKGVNRSTKATSSR